MPKLFDEEGNEIEGAMSPEDVTTLKTELDTAKKELLGLNNKDINFTNLREKVTGLETKLTDSQKAIEDANKKAIEGMQAPLNEAKDTTIAKLSGGDEELKKKIQFHFDRINDQTLTVEQMNKKVRDAYLLATEKAMDLSGQIISSAGAGMHIPLTPKKEMSAELKGFGSKLGLTDEDIKKYDK
jgi:Mg2+ and Co2+ transporter CorA